MYDEAPVRHSKPTFVPSSLTPVGEVVASGEHVTGTMRRRFEDALTRTTGVPRIEAVQSGSAALHLALLALRAGPGDRVLCPSYTCVAVLNAITATGASIELVDARVTTIHPETEEYVAAAGRAEARGDRVAAAIVIHQFGFPAPLPDIEVPIIEDCATALGSTVERAHGIRSACGTLGGRIAIWSFYATKVISTGHGGAIGTEDEALAERIADLLQYDAREQWTEPTWNYRLSDVAAALGLSQLERLGDFLARRVEIAARYAELCDDLGIDRVGRRPGTWPNHYRVVVRTRARDELIAALGSHGVEAKSPVHTPLHRLVAGAHDDSPCPGADELHETALSLPCYPALTDEELDRVEGALRAFVSDAVL